MSDGKGVAAGMPPDNDDAVLSGEKREEGQELDSGDS